MDKVTAGDSLTKHLKASTWNAFVDAATAHKMRTHKPTESVLESREVPSNTVIVRNDTGAAVSYGAVLSITGPLITPTLNLSEFKYRAAFTAGTPTAADHGNYVIAAGAIDDGKLGLAFCSGVVAVQVETNDTTLKRCDIDAGTSANMLAMPNGTAQILWIQSGTGTKWAAVRLGVLRDALCVGKTTGAVTAGSVGQVTVYNDSVATSTVIDGVQLDWMHGGEGISGDKEVLIAWFAEERLWRFIGAECE